MDWRASYTPIGMCPCCPEMSVASRGLGWGTKDKQIVGGKDVLKLCNRQGNAA